MSRFISNRSCEMCKKIEKGLVEMRVADTKHYLCYRCMTVFAFDVIEFASYNLREEFRGKGYEISATNEGGFVIEREKDEVEESH